MKNLSLNDIKTIVLIIDNQIFNETYIKLNINCE